MIHIAQDGSGDFLTITAALQTLPADHQENVVLFIHNGIYRERPAVTIPHVTFLGESKERTILSYDLYARMMMPDGMRREYAKTVLIDCYIGEHICEDGWDDWGKEIAHSTVYYGEYGSFGPSSDMKKRPGWVRRLTAGQAAGYTKEAVLSGADGWTP